jgi:hypothetical protein
MIRAFWLWRIANSTLTDEFASPIAIAQLQAFAISQSSIAGDFCLLPYQLP